MSWVAAIFVVGLLTIISGPQAPAQPVGTANLWVVLSIKYGGAPLRMFASSWSDVSTARQSEERPWSSDGVYAFPRLPSGTYEISTTSPGMEVASALRTEEARGRSGTPILVGDGPDVEGLDDSNVPGRCGIAGRVSGHNDQPLIGVVIQGWRMRYGVSGRFLELVGTAEH